MWLFVVFVLFVIGFVVFYLVLIFVVVFVFFEEEIGDYVWFFLLGVNIIECFFCKGRKSVFLIGMIYVGDSDFY